MKSKNRARPILAIALLTIIPAQFYSQACKDFRLDKTQVQEAMTWEILGEIGEKAASETNPAARTLDFRAERAYQLIGSELLAQRQVTKNLTEFLMNLFHTPTSDPTIQEFQQLVKDFRDGMTYEICDSLEEEWDLACTLVENIGEFNRRLCSERSITSTVVAAKLDELDIPPGYIERIATLEKKWKKQNENSSSFENFKTTRKNIFQSPPAPGIELIFYLGDKYQNRFPFIQQFNQRYQEIGREFLVCALETKRILMVK